MRIGRAYTSLMRRAPLPSISVFLLLTTAAKISTIVLDFRKRCRTALIRVCTFLDLLAIKVAILATKAASLPLI